MQVAVGLPVLMMILVSGIASMAELSIRLSMRMLGRKNCPHCGKVFGISTIQRARAAAKRLPNNKSLKYRFKAKWPLECLHCQSKFTVDPNDWTLSSL
jgi:hypothetical protein